MFHITFVQISEFDWLPGPYEDKFLKNIEISSQKPEGG